MVTSERLPLLGELQGEHIVLTELGRKVAEEIERIPTYKGASSIEIYDYVVSLITYTSYCASMTDCLSTLGNMYAGSSCSAAILSGTRGCPRE